MLWYLNDWIYMATSVGFGVFLGIAAFVAVVAVLMKLFP